MALRPIGFITDNVRCHAGMLRGSYVRGSANLTKHRAPLAPSRSETYPLLSNYSAALVQRSHCSRMSRASSGSVTSVSVGVLHGTLLWLSSFTRHPPSPPQMVNLDMAPLCGPPPGSDMAPLCGPLAG